MTEEKLKSCPFCGSDAENGMTLPELPEGYVYDYLEFHCLENARESHHVWIEEGETPRAAVLAASWPMLSQSKVN